MTNSSRIAVDAMGGDEGIAVMLAGVAAARRRFEGVQFYLVGDRRLLAEEDEAQRPVLAPGAVDSGNDRPGTDVAAHGIDRDSRRGVHSRLRVSRAQASVETISRPL